MTESIGAVKAVSVALVTVCLAACDVRTNCTPDLSISGRNGAASLSGLVVGRLGTARQERHRVECASVLILRSSDYADTLATGRLDLGRSGFSISRLDTGTVDIIFDHKDYFPVKLAGYKLKPGHNRPQETLLMWSSETPLAIPGEFGVVLKHAASIPEFRRIALLSADTRVVPEPGSYRVILPFNGANLTRRRVVSLCRNLAHSIHVADVRPYTNMTSVEHGL